METSMPSDVPAQADIATEANGLGVDLSEVFEIVQEDAVRESKSARWIEENRKACAEYDGFVEANGVFGDGKRLF
jgi:post-segregation antitoxin (ccd killing protein)